jgi:hypothetical protein
MYYGWLENRFHVVDGFDTVSRYMTTSLIINEKNVIWKQSAVFWSNCWQICYEHVTTVLKTADNSYSLKIHLKDIDDGALHFCILFVRTLSIIQFNKITAFQRLALSPSSGDKRERAKGEVILAGGSLRHSLWNVVILLKLDDG